MSDQSVRNALVRTQSGAREVKQAVREVKSVETDVTRFQAGRALKVMYPGENLPEQSATIAEKFDAHAGELAISGFGVKSMPSETAKNVLMEVRSYDTGPALASVDLFTGLVKSVDPAILEKPVIKFVVTLYNPVKAFFRTLQTANTRLEQGKLSLESQRRKLVKNISSLEGLEETNYKRLRQLLIYAHAAELVTLREEKLLSRLESTNKPDDLTLPARIDNQRTVVARLNRRTLDLKAAALRALLEAKVDDAGQKALVIIHDDIQFAVDVLYDQFVTQVAAAIILFQGKKAGEKSAALRTASADLAQTTGRLLGQVTEQGASYLTNAQEDLRGLVVLRDAVVSWSGKTREVAQLAKETRKAGEEQMQAISDSLQSAAKSFDPKG